MSTEAVIFLGRDNISKIMLFPEFEAILDHVVGVPEFASQRVKAVFIRINRHLQVSAAVFFYCGFDATGKADRDWNLPLSHLADKGGRGPDLGAGPIRLSCRSLCTVSWHQRELWDPVMDTKPTTFDTINQLVKRNRLGLDHEPLSSPDKDSHIPVLTNIDSDIPSPSFKKALAQAKLEIEQQFKQQQSATADATKLRMATLTSEAREKLEKLHRHYQSELTQLEETKNNFQRMLNEEKNKNKRYKETLNAQSKGLHEERERFQEHLLKIKSVEGDHLEALKNKFDKELQASKDAAVAEYKEKLALREVELFYREEQLSSMREEIVQLRADQQALLSDGGDRLLTRLAQAGITFVAYQPGLEHLAVPQRDLFEFLEAPVDYVAQKYGVASALYQQWLSHYQWPVCQHELEDSICGEPILKVDRPIDFIPSDSDRCDAHKSSLAQSTHDDES